MNEQQYADAFEKLTEKKPFPWQRALYERFVAGDFPATATLPTGLGKTMVIAVWLLALATAPKDVKVPRRLVYVVNRRTVVDQSTREAEKLRENLSKCEDVFKKLAALCSQELGEKESPLAISTLRGQFADNREWSADPSRPAVIVGTVDMIGSRLLFSGYGCGFKTRPLHAGFLGQDSLLVHDEAHLEPAFQKLIEDIRDEQKRCGDFGLFHVMELTATARNANDTFELTDEDRKHPLVQKRTQAKKTVHLHENKDEKKLADEIAALALQHKDSNRAVLVFVRKVDDVDKVVKKLPADQTRQLTGTLRGLERDNLVRHPVFIRFLPDKPKDVEERPGTVYLVCTSAGEVGVNISADHLVCDLSTFESMAQRFGRVNRFGDRDDTRMDVVHPKEFDAKDDQDVRLQKTLDLLKRLNGDGSPAALGQFPDAERIAAFSAAPTILPTSDILFDAWALTTIRDKLPGRPPVEPYLHGVSGWEPPETHVAWREEVGIITGEWLKEYKPEDLLEKYPLKPHELLRDRSDRVFKQLTEIAKRHPDSPAWLVDDDDNVKPFTLKELADKDEKDRINNRTILLPPSVGGLSEGMLSGTANEANDVSSAHGNRIRLWDDDKPPDGMKPIHTINLTDPDAEEESAKRVWTWYELQTQSDGEDLNAAKKPVAWQVHTDDVVKNTTRIVNALPLPEEMRAAFIVAAKLHDLGKKRKLFQRVLGNNNPNVWLAKSGKKGGRVKEVYRHEFGSLLDAKFDEGDEWKDFILHVIATHHGRGRPHFASDEAFDPERPEADAKRMASQVPQRFGRLQRKYGRWGLAYLESLLRAADYAASAKPSEYVEDTK